ncbi:uncharacterized protein BNAA03G24310D isoform X3 [Brassica napus]|uniref:uncharacterized protein BNAA03G24310D isoform X3 n=1 Tax=Brassica napus TaxID=3708 RepID=UPI0006AB23C7|nr:uncharacterized protein BNAA03G24310D isoform X3 [Brassica napus]
MPSLLNSGLLLGLSYVLECFSRWESIPRKFPWKFKKTETMYFLEGKLKVTIDEQQKEEKEVAFELTAGDLVVIPKGMTVVVDVTEAVKKHYYRDSEIVKYESPSKA